MRHDTAGDDTGHVWATPSAMFISPQLIGRTSASEDVFFEPPLARPDGPFKQSILSIYYTLFVVPPAGPILVHGGVGRDAAENGATFWQVPGMDSTYPEATALDHPTGALAPGGGELNFRATGFAATMDYQGPTLLGPKAFLLRNVTDERDSAIFHPVIRDCAQAGWDLQFIHTIHAWVNHPSWGVGLTSI